MNPENIEIHFHKFKTFLKICFPLLPLGLYLFGFQQIMNSKIDIMTCMYAIPGMLIGFVCLSSIALLSKWISGKPALVIREDGLFDNVCSDSLIEWSNIRGFETTLVGSGNPFLETTNRFENWFQSQHSQLTIQLHHPEAIFVQQTQLLKTLQLKFLTRIQATPIGIPMFHLEISLNELQILLLRKMLENKALQNKSNLHIHSSADLILPFTLDETDYLNSYLYFFNQSQMLHAQARMLTIVLLTMFSGIILSFIFAHNFIFIWVGCVFILFGSLFLLPKPLGWVVHFLKRIAKIGFQQAHRKPQYLGQTSDSSFKIAKDQIEITVPTGAVQQVPVEQIRVIHETSNYYFFELITNNRLVIPKFKMENGVALKVKMDEFIAKFNILYVSNLGRP